MTSDTQLAPPAGKQHDTTIQTGRSMNRIQRILAICTLTTALTGAATAPALADYHATDTPQDGSATTVPLNDSWATDVDALGWSLETRWSPWRDTASQAGMRADYLQSQLNEVLATTEGGTQISDYEIAWEGGKVVMAFPLPGEKTAPPSSPAVQHLAAKAAGPPVVGRAEAGILAADNCPTEAIGNDWYCFWDHENFEGRRLQWNNTHTTRVRFSEYGFQNRVSSWSNKGGKTIRVYKNSGTNTCLTSGGVLLWTEAPHSRNSAVANSDDNQADCFTARNN